jgi:mono/diheme cytochrome c family protein
MLLALLLHVVQHLAYRYSIAQYGRREFYSLLLGPALTGKNWLWSDGSYAGIRKTITKGVARPKQYRSPMPPMGGAQLTSDQVSAVAAYVWSISHHGSSNGN